MKNILILFAAVLIVTSCSTSDNSDDGGPIGQEGFSFTIGGEEVIITSWEGVKVENRLAIVGRADNGRTIAIEFNKFGNLGYAASYSTGDTSEPYMQSFAQFSSNYFNFELVSIDEENMKVSGTFSGNLYDDEYNINSDTIAISGTFNVSYTEEPSPVPGAGLSAKLDGVNWNYSLSDQSGGFFSGSNVSLNHFNDDAYTITVVVNHDITVPGTYSFTQDSEVHRIDFFRYDPATNMTIEYNATGTLVITEKDAAGIGFSLVKGTFEGTVTDPTDNSTISITAGVFTGVYSNY